MIRGRADHFVTYLQFPIQVCFLADRGGVAYPMGCVYVCVQPERT